MSKYLIPVDEIPRGTSVIVCPVSGCGLEAERVKATDEERNANGCGRSWDCCAATFLCENGHRSPLRYPAPEMSDD